MRIEKTLQSALSQMLAANSDDIDKPVSLATKSINQVGSKQIAGFLSGHDCDFQWPAGFAHPVVSFVLRLIVSIKRPSAFAAAKVPPRPGMKVRPASIAMPERPARAAFSTVDTPIAGRSARSSCLGFAIFTSTPPRREILP